MNQLVIMQGPPGSGKTTLARIIAQGGSPAWVVCSTDDFFMEDGVYRFERDKLPEAHAWNQRRVLHLLARGKSAVVDNTNIRRWEARPYVELAMQYDTPVAFVRCTGQHQSTHGVPLEKIEQMRRQMEELTVEGCLAARYPWEPKIPVTEVRLIKRDSDDAENYGTVAEARARLEQLKMGVLNGFWFTVRVTFANGTVYEYPEYVFEEGDYDIGKTLRGWSELDPKVYDLGGE